MTVDILGVVYTIVRTTDAEDTRLEDVDGFCDWTQKRIVVIKCQPKSRRLWNLELYEKKVLRHEIIHAFLHESGLSVNTASTTSGWAYSEEVVDWFALQGPKILKAWQEAEAL